MGNNVPAASLFIVLSDIDPSGQDDRETWADLADLHECLARTIETNFAKAAHALDIRRLQNRKHLVTASVDDRLRGCRHGKRGLYITAASHGTIRTTASRSENAPLRAQKRRGASCAMCGRLRVGKGFLHVCRLVGAAMCSAC